MKRAPGIPGWYCAHGLPKGFEAQAFRAQGLAPLSSSKTYTRMVKLAGYEVVTGHDERGDSWLWVSEPLARLIPCGVELRYRVFMCTQLREMDASARERFLVELDAAARLAGEAGFTAVLGPCPTIFSNELHGAWMTIYPPNERRYF